MDILEKLQYHDSKVIYGKTVKLLQKHFELEQDMEFWWSMDLWSKIVFFVTPDLRWKSFCLHSFEPDWGNDHEDQWLIVYWQFIEINLMMIGWMW